jgi:hypothetical protein
LLFDVPGLKIGDQLENAVVTFLGQIPSFARLLSMQADKFIKINAYRTSLTAASTTQAGPNLRALNKVFVRFLHRGAPYNLSG